MGNAAFVLIAVAVSALGSLLLWALHRRPRTFMSSIDEFQREMKALSHEEEEQAREQRQPARPGEQVEGLTSDEPFRPDGVRRCGYACLGGTLLRTGTDPWRATSRSISARRTRSCTRGARASS